MKRYLSLFLLLLCQQLFAETNLIKGKSVQFFGPDELFLDPALSVIAVDVNGGNGDLEVNGVTFLSDGVGGGVGTATTDGVTVTTTATNNIPAWQTAPFYDGIDAPSATNLGLIMHSIRWDAAPATVDVDISGLTSGVLYDIQLLFSENGSGADRHWDIGVDGALIADDWTSVGPTQDGGTSSANHGYAYNFEATPGEDGILNIVMGQDPFSADPNNTAPEGADNNPILHAVIVHVNAVPSPPSDIELSSNEIPAGVPIGTQIGNLSSIDPNGGTHSYSLVAGDGDDDNSKFLIDGDKLETAADLSADGGMTLTVRVRSEDDGGLSFAKAIDVIVTSDGDGDGLEDNWEERFGTRADFTGLLNGPGPGAGTGDFDGDGSSDLEELMNGTFPNDPDSDDDNLNDGDEAAAKTNPLDEDTDKDNLKDGDEEANMTDPLDPDTDGDTLLDGDEVAAGIDPTKPDTDGDEVNDNLDPAPNDPNIISFTTVIVGEIIEFSGPDDLNLDPASSVIAVNVGGDGDVEVSGVNFLGDVAGGNTATANGVTVTTTTDNQIPGWATAELTGGDATSTDNLEIVMQSIRWTPAPGPVNVDISGLTPGALYEVQLLTDEGRLRDRNFDISVEDELVVDNYTSSGLEGVQNWTGTNGFSYVAEFEGPADGILNIVLQQQIGGIEPRGGDNNPILQGVIVHQAGPGTPFVITNLDYAADTGTSTLTWNSTPGATYILEYSVDLKDPWIEVDDGIDSEGDTTTFIDPINRPDPVGFYRVRIAP